MAEKRETKSILGKFGKNHPSVACLEASEPWPGTVGERRLPAYMGRMPMPHAGKMPVPPIAVCVALRYIKRAEQINKPITSGTP